MRSSILRLLAKPFLNQPGSLSPSTRPRTCHNRWSEEWGHSNPGIVYIDQDGVRYAKRAGNGTWTTTTIDTAGGPRVDLLFDGSYARIAYAKGSLVKPGIVYASESGGGWQKEYADSGFHASNPYVTPGNGYSMSLAFDTTNNPYIAYSTGTCGNGGCDQTLRLAWKQSGTWHAATVDSAQEELSDTGEYARLAMGYADHHIVYYN